MTKKNKFISVLTAAALLCTGIGTAGVTTSLHADAAESIESSMDWDTLNIAGGGFVSGIITGDDQMYARTDVGGAYRYDYEQKKWVQLLGFLNDADRGFLSVDAMCVDPNDDDTLYLLCGCAYFSDARTVIFRSHDAGETFEEIDVTDLIQVHGNGYGRQTGEAIAVDPDNPDIIYCGGDATAGDSALIMSEDGGDTWSPVMGYDKLGLFEYSIKWPTWTEHMARSVADDEYLNVNGIATIKITDGKVYVGTSVKGKANLHVADVGSDDFQPLSESPKALTIRPSRSSWRKTATGYGWLSKTMAWESRRRSKRNSIRRSSPPNRSGKGPVSASLSPSQSSNKNITERSRWNPNRTSSPVSPSPFRFNN